MLSQPTKPAKGIRSTRKSETNMHDRALKLARDVAMWVVCGLAVAAVLAGIGRCADLPSNDRGLYQMIVVCPKTDAPLNWFTEVPELSKLRLATAFTWFSPSAPLFKERYQSILGANFPIVAYLRPDGGVVYFSDKANMPTRDKLYDAINTAHLKAKDAVAPAPAITQAEFSDDYTDCPDGLCPLKPSEPSPRFPRLHPFQVPSEQPFDRMVSGWFSNSINSGLFMVFSIIALGFCLVFGVLLLGVIVVLARWIR